ncbi:hypothetical protein MA16_Dca028694 [Dendrobium catenatum]|uniref:Uncharacterized protein n=1 Tax=Dendrobium catenatum TaxID=906689 RepID=A0A2I0V884_9ASPA|nr:hypothetical protein MA16_Dca028694 [Dendrobium catenatum]
MSNERYTIVGFDISHPFNHSLFAPDLTPIYELCHSRKSINRTLILHKRGSKQEERKKRRKKLLLDRRQNIAGPPQEPHRTTVGTSPDHRQNLAGPPPELRRTTPPQGPMFRPNVLLKTRRPA